MAGKSSPYGGHIEGQALNTFLDSGFLQERPQSSYMNALDGALETIVTHAEELQGGLRSRPSPQPSSPSPSKNVQRNSSLPSIQTGARGSAVKSRHRESQRPMTPIWTDDFGEPPRARVAERRPHSLVGRIEAFRVERGCAPTIEASDQLPKSVKANDHWLKVKKQGLASVKVVRTMQQDVQAGASGTRVLRPPIERKEMMKLRLSAPRWWRMPTTSMRAAESFDKMHHSRSARADQLCLMATATQRADLCDEFNAALFSVRTNRYFDEPKKAKVQHIIKARRAPKKNIFDVYKSIWGPRCITSDSCDLYDSDEAEFRRFTLDWSTLLELGITKFVLMHDDDGAAGALQDEDGDGIPDEVEDVGMVLWNCHDLLHALFTHYAILSGGFVAMSFNSWTTFTDDFRLCSKKSKFSQRKDLDLIFISVNASSKHHGTKAAQKMGDSELTLSRLEFYAALVRLAVRRYVLPGDITDVSEALEKLILYDIHKRALSVGLAAGLFADSNEFRKMHAYTEPVCTALKLHEKSLRNLFAAIREMGDGSGGGGAKGDDKTLLSLNEWLAFTRGAQLIERDLSERDAMNCFAWSRMIVVDYQKGKGLRRDTCLTFEGFMEALCRASTLKALPTEAEIQRSTYANVGEYLEGMRGSKEYETMMQTRATPWGEEPKRPIEESLLELVDVVRHAVEKSNRAKADGVISETEAKCFASTCWEMAAAVRKK
eukprot:CAMPEP_0115838464 /NCGR_PEP_ID=MMETSP0287-20121206/5740_1 /TAXON_ID=412157 /ORGANISM="Chrysochromulina rotalis, Strain UIO044" /LENGTH=715 /DNA_ID=CAMNT_0003291987 /DNA_START=62 /DNA_END=2209 /DNA_ORIENTATION=+